MAVVNGSLVMFTMDGHPMGCAKSCTLTYDVDTPDASCKESNGNTYRIAGKMDWGGSFDGLYDPSGTYNFEYLFDEVKSRSTSTIVEVANIDGAGGGEVYRGVAIINHIELGADMEVPATYAGTFVANGPLNKGTVSSS